MGCINFNFCPLQVFFKMFRCLYDPYILKYCEVFHCMHFYLMRNHCSCNFFLSNYRQLLSNSVLFVQLGMSIQLFQLKFHIFFVKA